MSTIQEKPSGFETYAKAEFSGDASAASALDLNNLWSSFSSKHTPSRAMMQQYIAEPGDYEKAQAFIRKTQSMPSSARGSGNPNSNRAPALAPSASLGGAKPDSVHTNFNKGGSGSGQQQVAKPSATQQQVSKPTAAQQPVTKPSAVQQQVAKPSGTRSAGAASPAMSPPVPGAPRQLSPGAYEGQYWGSDEEIIQAWLKEVLGEELETPLQPILKSGVVLCNLVNKIRPGTIKKISKAAMPFPQRENVKSFCDAARNLGVPDRDNFTTDDLFENRNFKQVKLCLFSLGRQCYYVPDYEGPCIGRPEMAKRIN
eukprot:CAMPEP_0184320550 /NCGR_PEP_ID=MMETSP1049-20130417/114439_1 /TAXON_ID=77928 /ORGANISM="Proteomonas sulcata, Strain CCMP704" /LENGTH=312 /DNA_ID=CAMNT_0026641083 /DNA_START=171 /DNA_END=1109 /DNA_ORIENTATION=+